MVVLVLYLENGEPMARKVRTTKRTKVVPLFIVEGDSEEVYIKRCKSVYSKAAKVNNANGGSARNVLQQAQKIIAENATDYSNYIVWFDVDTYFAPDRNLKNQVQAEHWLLAHFQAINLQANQNCDRHNRTLTTHIPHYKKGDEQQIKRYINEPQIEAAINNYPTLGTMITTHFK